MTTCSGESLARKAENDMEKTEKEPRGFCVEKGSFFAHAAVTVLVLSIAARLLGTMTLWGDMNAMLIEIVLPLGSALLFILFILLLGRIALWTTILPVLGGAAFFILSNFHLGADWPLFICIALAFLAAFVYTATLSGMIRSQWPLAVILALILAYMIVYRAIPVFGNTADPVSFVDGMKLLSSIGLVFAVFCATLGMRRRRNPKSEPELPKIKDPKVIPPAEAANAETASEPAIEPAPSEAAAPAEPEAAPETEIPAQENSEE